ncbi:hypothetical protein C1645_742631 [Glomus cerebriforme]|uniref:Uncharacterized protein n=1 Tax=Glomus cerebriforme TaxID=658196 RepID=A0A397SES7_9GLOM|nr:hypothetical protein C1645_742631 [Glomus cerebriforme]
MALRDKDDDEREKEIIIAEKWVEKGYISITIAGIKRLLRLGYVEFRVENDIELINKYIRYRDLLDNELKIKIDELDDEAETEKKSKGLERLNENLGLNITKGELVRLIKMGFKGTDILNKEFIELFQENKNEKEKDIKEILDKYLRRQTEIGGSSKKKEEKKRYLECPEYSCGGYAYFGTSKYFQGEMTQEKKCVKCDWKIPRVGRKTGQAMEEHCEECHLGKRTFEGCKMCKKPWKECKCLCREHGEGCIEAECT